MSRGPARYARILATLTCAGVLLVPPLADADTCSGLSLATLAPATVGAAPNAVVVGDFNRDGRMDVVVANSASNNISVLLGNGAGGFAQEAGSPILTGGSPVDLAAGDLDRDGFLDLVVSLGTQVKVMRRLPGGFDNTAIPFAVGGTANRVYLADLTHDSFLDLVVVSSSGNRITSYQGAGFNFSAVLATIDVSVPGPPETPSAVATGDFNRDGKLDLAVAFESSSEVNVYFGNGLPAGSFFWTNGPTLPLVGVTAPRDIAAGDVDRDGWPDLVTANFGSGNASVIRNNGGTLLTQAVTPLPVGVASRVVLADLNHDGLLDLAALDDSATPRVTAFAGLATGPPWFSVTAAAAALPASSAARGLAVGRFTADGRVDFVTALSVTNQAVVVENGSGTPCARASFAGAPRSYAAGSGPVSTAAADFDRDGRNDLVVASSSDASLRVLKNANGGFTAGAPISPLSPPPRAVAVADMNVDGNMDVVVAQGTAAVGRVQVYLGDGTGGLSAGATQLAGDNLSAVVVGDWNGDGAQDIAAASEGTGQVFVFLGNGLGGFGAGTPVSVGTSPRALVAGLLDADATLDLAVANFGSNSVTVLRGNGDGSFTGLATLAVGNNPRGIAAADVDGDGRLDLATANFGSSQVSVIRRDGAFNFLPAVAYPVGSNPSAVALVDLAGDPKPDVAVTSSTSAGAQVLAVLPNNGAGVFSTPGSDYAVRQAPQAITPFDADGDGLLDLVIPCRDGGSVVILVNRPPALQAAPRVVVGDKPRAAVVGDWNGDGKLDLAVANSGDNTVSLLAGDGLGGLASSGTLTVAAAEAIVAGDFNRDGQLDLGVSSPGGATPSVAIFLGTGGGAFGLPSPVILGGTPDDLVAGDFDGDGDLDIAVCDKVATGTVRILSNNGLGTFTLLTSVGVGDKPTAIVTADFDRDGDLDLAVANDDSNNVMFLTNSSGSFTVTQALALAGGDTSPISLAAGDFEGNGTIALVAAAFGNDRLHVYRNQAVPLTPFVTTPVALDTPFLLQAVAAADLTLDARTDLVALADGVTLLRGLGGMSFDVPQTVVARYTPSAAVVGDFNRDGRPDVAVVNEGSDDVSLLLSSACQAQSLELSVQPSACQLGAPPFLLDAQAKAFDDGGNLASCATNLVTPSIVPGTGTTGAVLGGGGPQSLAGGIASWTGGTALSIDRAGRRYRLQFQATGLAPLHGRSFTLGPDATVIDGPSSVCPSSAATYTLLPDPGYDTYAWSVDGSPLGFTPAATLVNPPLALNTTHILAATARVDACVVTPPNRSIYAGNLASVTLDVLGASTVCVDCIGGSAKAIETGGGTAVRQWGYRTTSGFGAPVSLPGETGDTYVLKGSSFPGPDTYYVVVTSSPACGTPLVSNEWAVTVVPDVPSGEVLHLAASSRGNSTSGQNKLLWVNTTGSIEEVKIRWDEAPAGTTGCLPPANLTAPFDGEVTITTPTAGVTDSYLHSGLLLDTSYCYSVFVKVSGAYSPGRTIKARPFDATGQVKWAYATGGTAVAPPTVNGEGIVAMSNDRTVHSLTRGSAGGEWPASWVPTALTGVAHSRSPVVPFVAPLNGANTVLFTADDTGYLYAIDAKTGVRPWPAQGPFLSITGAPGGIFTQYAGIRDALFVGTRDNSVDNAMRALDLATGAFLEAYSPVTAPGPIGPINGTPAIDYPTRRIYFASHKRLTGDTLFCLEIGATSPVFTYKWSRDLGSITGSPVLRGGRVYVATDAGSVYSLDAASGGDDHTIVPADGPVKGFLFPDRRNGDLIFATTTKVWSVTDGASSFAPKWQWTDAGLNPSLILYWPGTNLVYVGSANGKLYELDFTSANPSTAPTFKLKVLGGGLGQVGAPSLDIGVTPKLLLVGSEPGVVYGLEVPFLP